MFLSVLKRKFSLFSSRKKLQPKNKNWDHFSKVFGKFAYEQARREGGRRVTVRGFGNIGEPGVQNCQV